MFKKIWNQIIVSIPHFDQFFYYSHENFVILAKFCCHSGGIFQCVNNSLRGRRSFQDDSPENIFCLSGGLPGAAIDCAMSDIY